MTATAFHRRAADSATHRRHAVARNRRWLTLAVLCVSLLIIVIDNTIVNVTLPSLVRQLGASVSQLQWVVDAYTVVFAGLLLLAGTLGDRWGRRRSPTIGLAVFARRLGRRRVLWRRRPAGHGSGRHGRRGGVHHAGHAEHPDQHVHRRP